MKGGGGTCCISSEPRWGVKVSLVSRVPSPQPGTKATVVYFGRELWRRERGRGKKEEAISSFEYKVHRRITGLKIIPCYRRVANLLLVIIIMIIRSTLSPSKNLPHTHVHPT